MEEDKKKKRGWVKDAAIIFLAVLLVLTFFSNTILNRSLPEVATVYVQEGTITNKVRGTGTVTARENYDVTIDQTRKVQSVLVRVGDEVAVGDVLFTLQPGDSDELGDAQKQLRSKEDSYQLKLLDLTVADYYKDERDIADARDALAEAREERDKAEITEEVLKEYEDKLAELEARQKELEESIELQQALVDSGSENVGELDDRSGVLRQLELQMRSLEELQHEKEVVVREINEKLEGVKQQADTVKSEKQKIVDEAQKKLDDIEAEIREKYGNHQDADYTPVDNKRDAYDAAASETDKAEKALESTRVVYQDEYNELLREAANLEYEDRVYAVLNDTEVKYRSEHKIAKGEKLTEEQEAEVWEQAQPGIEKLGDKDSYEPKSLSVFLSAAAEMHGSDPLGVAYQKIKSAQDTVTSKRSAQSAAYLAYQEAYADYREKKEDDAEFAAMDRKREGAITTLERAKKDMDAAMQPENDNVQAVELELSKAKAAKTGVDNDISDLNFRINQIKNGELADLNLELTDAKQKLTDLKSDLDKAKKDKEDLEADMEKREADYKKAKDTVKSAERTLEDRLHALEDSKKNTGKQQMRENIELRDLQEEIAELKAKVEELSDTANGTEVRANVSGKIQSLNVSAGHKAEAKQVLATIEVPDLGYSMNFKVTTEQARRLKVGDSATISNYYWGSQIVATLTSIQTDPQNPQGSRILNFDVTGDVTVGNSLTISIGEKNANYDMVVPNSAVRSDTNGSFVLMVTAKNSPLGNRYFASRVNVEVVASDDQYSAISGAIEAYDSVITTASRNAPISSGDQVRLADSNN